MHKVLCCIFACLLKVPHKCDNQDKVLNVKIYYYMDDIVVVVVFVVPMAEGGEVYHPSGVPVEFDGVLEHLFDIEFRALH